MFVSPVKLLKNVRGIERGTGFTAGKPVVPTKKVKEFSGAMVLIPGSRGIWPGLEYPFSNRASNPPGIPVFPMLSWKKNPVP